MASIFMLEIYIEPHNAADNIFGKVIQAIEKALTQVEGSYLQLFEVTGEDTVLVVLDCGVQAVKQEVRQAAGALVKFKCTPVRKYENFARLLGVTDEKILTVQNDLSGEGQLYWLRFKVEYKGLGSLDELFRRWKIEAEAALGFRAAGQVKLVLYKTVIQREVHAFVKVLSGDALDNMLPLFPILKEMGDQIWVTCKGLEFIK